MLDSFERMLIALWDHDVSRMFTIIIGVYFAFAIIWINSENPKIRAFVNNAPGAMTSLGILGTFVGVFLGLLDFDIRTINKSVPTLLEGLKVAFGTSILGLTSAVLFRLTSPILTRDTVAKKDASIEDIVEHLSRLENGMNQSNEIAADGFKGLEKALSDDRDTSIVGQLQRMRSNISDLDAAVRHGFEAQIKEFKEFAEHMSESFSKAIIEELQAVIREFNEKLTEQFGDNFKQLNEAVGRLVEWQEEYRQQMEELKEALNNAVMGVQASQRALDQIETSASKIPEHMEAMTQSNEILNSQLEKIEESLGSFAEMREKAINALPVIEKNIEDITLNLSTSVEHQTNVVKEITKSCERLVSSHVASAEELLEGFGEMRSTTKNVIDTLQNDVTRISEEMLQHIDKASTSLQTEVENAAREMARAVEGTAEEIRNHTTDSVAEQKAAQREMLEGLQSSFNETISNATDRMNDAIVQLDEALQSEIETVIRAMAENLSGITEKFVADYTPLLETTRRIVELGERVNRDEFRADQ